MERIQPRQSVHSPSAWRINNCSGLPAGRSITPMVRMGVARVIPVDVRWDFFSANGPARRLGPESSKPHNHQTCLLGSSGDGCPLSGPGISVPSPQHPDLHKMHLEDQIRVGRDQFPRWNLPKSHVARPKICQDALGAMPLEMEPGFQKEAPQNSTEFRNPSPISTDFCPPK